MKKKLDGWLRGMKELVGKKAPRWLLALMISAYHFLHPRCFKDLVLPAGRGIYVRFPFRVFGPDPRFILLDEDYFQVLRLGKGEIVLDVGACVGLSSFIAAHKVGKGGLVVAIEPDPDNLKWLRMNLGRLSNCIVVPKGVADRKGRRFLYRAEGGGIGSTLLPHSALRRVKVEISTIDCVCEELCLKRVDFMMMDVEGAELMALRGSRKTLRKTRKIVVAAYHLVRGKATWPSVKRFLEGMGFRTIVTEDGLVHGWRDPRENNWK